MTDAEIAGIMGWHGPGAYTEASLRKIRRIIEQVQAKERADIDAKLTAARRDAARYNFIEEHATMHGGGHGFTITCFVGADEEDMGVGIDKMIAAAPVHKEETNDRT